MDTANGIGQPNNAYPRDVTSPAPYQRPGIVESQEVAATEKKVPHVQKDGDKPTTPPKKPFSPQ